MIAGSSKPIAKKLEKVKLCPIKGCWLWTGAVDKDGYGRLRGTVNNIPWFKFAHRASYEFYVGTIPPDKQVLHKCDTPPCINPAHLYLGDPAQNGLDKHIRGRARTTPQFGEKNGMYGKTGALNPMYGKKHTEEALTKMRATKAKRGAK